MKVKKAGKRVFGAVMSAAEKKAMDMEIQRQLAEYDRKHIREIDALVLWELREQLGFGNKRLKKFYDNFSRGIEALIRRYEMEQGDDVWLCTYKLKEILAVILKSGRKKEVTNERPKKLGGLLRSDSLSGHDEP